MIFVAASFCFASAQTFIATTAASTSSRLSVRSKVAHLSSATAKSIACCTFICRPLLRQLSKRL